MDTYDVPNYFTKFKFRMRCVLSSISPSMYAILRCCSEQCARKYLFPRNMLLADSVTSADTRVSAGNRIQHTGETLNFGKQCSNRRRRTSIALMKWSTIRITNTEVAPTHTSNQRSVMSLWQSMSGRLRAHGVFFPEHFNR